MKKLLIITVLQIMLFQLFIPIKAYSKEAVIDKTNESIEVNTLLMDKGGRISFDLEEAKRNGSTAYVENLGGFASIEAAIEAIYRNGGTGTIHLLKDCSISETIFISSDLNITLTDDGAGYTITPTSNARMLLGMVFVDERATLTITGNITFLITYGIHLASGHYGYIITVNGKCILQSGIIDGNNKGIESFSGLISVCGKNAELIMNGGKIQNALIFASCGGVFVSCGGKFTMNDGEITGIRADEQLAASAVLVYANEEDYLTSGGNATFIMNGGTIHHNKGYRGTGVYLTGQFYETKASFIMNGGSISNNIANGFVSGLYTFQGAGAGVFVDSNAEFILNNGTIAYNEVYSGMGGGVATSCGYEDAPSGWSIENYSKYYPAAFIMNGGEISNNSAYLSEEGMEGCGGGIYVASNCVELKGGLILNNYAQRQGGGLYIGSIPYVVKIKNAIITENQAELLGGGVWLCPTGDAEIFVNEGSGVFDNTSKGAGDDIVSIKNASSEHILTLSNRMLGGGEVHWYEDGEVISTGVLGFPDENYPRYNENSRSFNGVIDSNDHYSIKAIATENAKKAAKSQATLLIMGNKSVRGGGIGSNGGLILGDKLAEEWKVVVTKEWLDGNGNDCSLRGFPIYVYLQLKNFVLEEKQLNEKNNWTAEFTGLPNPDTLINNMFFHVVENPIPIEYEVSYSDPLIDEDNRTIFIKVTNRYKQEFTGGLEILKTVVGENGQQDRKFEFLVTLSDKTINGYYGEMYFVDGIAQFELKHKNSITALNLPRGIEYIVEEKDYSSEGYKTRINGKKDGIIQKDYIEHVEFVNIKDDETPETGDNSKLSLYIKLIIISGLAFKLLHKLKKIYK